MNTKPPFADSDRARWRDKQRERMRDPQNRYEVAAHYFDLWNWRRMGPENARADLRVRLESILAEH